MCIYMHFLACSTPYKRVNDSSSHGIAIFLLAARYMNVLTGPAEHVPQRSLVPTMTDVYHIDWLTGPHGYFWGASSRDTEHDTDFVGKLDNSINTPVMLALLQSRHRN